MAAEIKMVRALKDVVYWDTFGSFGGVGVASKCLLAAFARAGVKVTLVGESAIIDPFRSFQCTNEGQIDYLSLTPTRYSPKWFRSRLSDKYCVPIGLDTRTADGFALLRDRDLIESNHLRCSNLLINFPQVLPPTLKAGAYSVLVHDLNWRLYPENFPHPRRTDTWCQSWVKGARFVMTNSEFTRQEIIREYGAMPEKVIAAPFAPDSSDQFQANGTVLLDSLQLVENQYYIYPASVGIHKGHDFLVSELAQLKTHFPVVLVGPHTDGKTLPPTPAQKKYFRTVQLPLRVMTEAGKTRPIGRITDEDMQVLQRHSRAFLLPSRYEGFGFPLVEAMQHNRPVICSDIPAYLELLARYAGCIPYRLFRLDSPGSMAELLKQDSLNQLEYDLYPPDQTTDVDWNWDRTAARIIESIT